MGSVRDLSIGEHYATLQQTGPEKQKIHFIEKKTMKRSEHWTTDFPRQLRLR